MSSSDDVEIPIKAPVAQDAPDRSLVTNLQHSHCRSFMKLLTMLCKELIYLPTTADSAEILRNHLVLKRTMGSVTKVPCDRHQPLKPQRLSHYPRTLQCASHFRLAFDARSWVIVPYALHAGSIDAAPRRSRNIDTAANRNIVSSATYPAK
jgi:hypothetical protein